MAASYTGMYEAAGGFNMLRDRVRHNGFLVIRDIIAIYGFFPQSGAEKSCAIQRCVPVGDICIVVKEKKIACQVMKTGSCNNLKKNS